LKAGERDSLPSPLKLKDCREILAMTNEQVVRLLDKWIDRAKHEAIKSEGWFKGYHNGSEIAFIKCKRIITEYLQKKGK
jgi:hypothetical protein